MLRTGPERTRFQPQRAGRNGWIEPGLFPPRSFIAVPMHLAMVSSAQRDCELIADLAAESPGLGEAEMMRVRRVRPQIRHGCLATWRTCSRSRARRGSG